VLSGAYVWRLRSGFIPDEAWLRAPEKIAGDDTRLVKPPAQGANSRVIRFALGGETIILKEYRAARPAARLKAVFRVPAAIRALQVCARLERLGLPVVEVLGAGYRRRSRWHSFLLTRELKSVLPFREYMRRFGGGRAIAALARLFGRLHAAKFLHRDAHLSNFVVETAGSEPNVVIVDVDAVRPCRNVTVSLAARDIGRLLDYSDPSAREMMRFAVIYARERGGKISARALLREMREYYDKRARFVARRQ
jgi:tRNA A-37 threonylcarbamoyl transferase component Bud32